MRWIVTFAVGLLIAFAWLIETGWLRAQEWSVPNYRHHLGYKRRHSVTAVVQRGETPLSVAEVLRRSSNRLPVAAQLLAVTAS